MSTVGLIGLGAMGSGMAGSLRRAGHAVQVFDVRREVAAAFAADGGQAHDTLASLGAACDVVVSVVVNAAQTEAVLFGDDTTPGCAASMKPGSVFVMCSTVDPNWSVALEARLEAMGLRYVDAPISGGATKGADAVFEDARAIRDGGGNGSIIGRNSFQRSRPEALALLDRIVRIYQNKE